MNNSKIAFYTKAGIIEKFINDPDIEEHPAIAEVIITAIRENKRLGDYFFRKGPNKSWCNMLQANGFFAIPPEPETRGENTFPGQWWAQNYLISIAGQVPDIFITHINSLADDSYYAIFAFNGLNKLEIDDKIKAIPKINAWLECNAIAWRIIDDVIEFIKELSQNGRTDLALQIFKNVTIPIPSPDAKKINEIWINDEAISRFEFVRGHFDISELAKYLASNNAIKTIGLLLIEVQKALDIEGEIGNNDYHKVSSRWREAIEDSGRDISKEYKDILLTALRESLVIGIGSEGDDFREIIVELLNSEYEIFHRLGLYLLGEYPDKYKDLVENQIISNENIHNYDIHHEYMILLQKGFKILKDDDKDKMINTIKAGPPQERVERVVESVAEMHAIDKEEYKERFIKRWIRDRLSMIEEFLNSNDRDYLGELVSEVGEPDDPEFIGGIVSSGFVNMVSPKSKEQINEMSIDDIVKYIKSWQPDYNKSFTSLTEETYGALGHQLANDFIDNPKKYEGHFIEIFSHKAEFCDAFIGLFEKEEINITDHWEFIIQLIEHVLKWHQIQEENIGSRINRWDWTRKTIIRLIEKKIKIEKKVPSKYSLPIKGIILKLCDDPDPTHELDDPEEGWFGHEDPTTVAINHVRPLALDTLMYYGYYSIPEENRPGEPGKHRFEDDIRWKFEEKLNKTIDKSWAVHSIFGKNLSFLHWMDKEWTEDNLEKIFPGGPDYESRKYFVAAWDSFVIFNKFILTLRNLLYSKYEMAIDNISKGYITKTHLDPAEHLVHHLVWNYLYFEKDLNLEGQDKSLLKKFYALTNAEMHGKAAWFMWRLIADNPDKRKEIWPLIRKIWRWRLSEARSKDQTKEYGAEMSWFAEISSEVKEIETLDSMKDDIFATVDYVIESPFGRGWDALEDYLASQVEKDPVNAIAIFQKMNVLRDNPLWSYKYEEEQKIIETAVKHKESRETALELIDFLGSRGVDRYRELYERYKNKVV